MKSRQRILACGLFAMIATGACGDDDNSGGGGLSTGLPTADKLSSLSDDDTGQVCTKTATAFNNLLPKSELKRIACVSAAITKIDEDGDGDVGADDIPMCKQLSSTCVSSSDIKDEDLVLDIADATDCDNASTDDTFGDCAATVADYESCVGRVLKELRTRFSSLTCDGLNDVDKLDEMLNGDIDVSKASECEAIRTKCPDVKLVLEASTDD